MGGAKARQSTELLLLYINKIKSVFASYGSFDTGLFLHFWTDFGKLGGYQKVSVRRWNSLGWGGQNLPWLDSKASGTIDFKVVTKRITQDKMWNFSRFKEKFGKRQLLHKKKHKMWKEKVNIFIVFCFNIWSWQGMWHVNQVDWKGTTNDL